MNIILICYYLLRKELGYFSGIARRYEYISMHSWPQHQREVNGQLHAPTALPPVKEPLLPIR